MRRPLAVAPLALVVACSALKDGSDTLGPGCVPLTVSDDEAWVAVDAPPNGTGVEACPLQTITEAAHLFGDRRNALIHVGPGLYTAGSGELFPITLRDGLSLVGAGRTETIIRGGRLAWAPFPGRTESWWLEATLVVGDGEAETSVSDLSVEPREDAAPNSTYGVLCDRGNAIAGSAAEPSPNTALTRVGIHGFEDAVVATNSRESGVHACSLRITECDLGASHVGLHAVFAGGEPGGQLVEVREHTVFTGLLAPGGGGRAVVVGPGTRAVRVYGATFTDSDGGVRVEQGPQEEGLFELRDAQLHDLREVGVELASPATVLLERNVFERIQSATPVPARALVVSAPTAGRGPQLRARENRFFANDLSVDLALTGLPTGEGPQLDFGTPEDAGSNTFRCSSAPVGRAQALPDVRITLQRAGGDLPMAGNTWDHAPPSGPGGEPSNGDDVRVVASAPGTLDLSGATTEADPACPADRAP